MLLNQNSLEFGGREQQKLFKAENCNRIREERRRFYRSNKSSCSSKLGL